MTARHKERLVEQRVTYTLEMEGKVYIVENVPARVDEETGEQFFCTFYSRAPAGNYPGRDRAE